MTPFLRNRKRVLLGIVLATFATPFMSSSINIALPEISSDFGIDAVTLPWITTVFLLTSIVFLLPFGRLADMYGANRIFLIGNVFFTLATLMCGFSNSGTMLIIARGLQGVAGAMIYGLAVSIISNIFPQNERGKLLGINTAIVYFGIAVGPFLGGILTSYMGWQYVFFLLAPVPVIAVALMWPLASMQENSERVKFDHTGAWLLGLALVLLTYGLTRITEITGIIVFVIGTLVTLIFLRWESRNIHPLLQISLFLHNRAFMFSSLAAFANYSATYPISLLTSLYLQYLKNLTPESAGTVLLIMPAFQALLSPVSGRLSDRVEPRILATAGMALTCVGLCLFIFIGSETSMAYILLTLGILGVGFGLFSSPNTNAIMNSVEPQYYGIASALVSFFRQVGMVMSMAIVTVAFTLLIGEVEITPPYYPQFLSSVTVSFIIFAAFCFLGIFASLARGKSRHITKPDAGIPPYQS